MEGCHIPLPLHQDSKDQSTSVTLSRTILIMIRIHPIEAGPILQHLIQLLGYPHPTTQDQDAPIIQIIQIIQVIQVIRTIMIGLMRIQCLKLYLITCPAFHGFLSTLSINCGAT